MEKPSFIRTLEQKKLILASQSPRRQYLLRELGLNFELKVKSVDEDFSPDLKREEIPLYLSKLKAAAFSNEELESNAIIITADTIVWIENQVLNKPKDSKEAVRMIKFLSGKSHEVITAVTLKSKNKTHSFFAVTTVHFKKMSDEEINYYVDKYTPLDKAGAYGAQEWIGYVGIEKIEGSYFNVMGLPVKELYEELIKF